MNSSSEPRLNKLPFFLTDAACLLVALLIGLYAKDPFAPLPFLTAVALVVFGACALIIPYLRDYAADSRESANRLREELELQIKRVQAATDSLSRAAAQIKAIEEAVHKSARDAETLPYRMQEKLAEFNEALATKESDDREALENELDELRAANADQLKAVADKIAKTTADWTALEAAIRKQLAAAEAALAKLHASSADSAQAHTAKLAAITDDTAAKLQTTAAAATTEFQSKVGAALQELDTRIDALKQAAAALNVAARISSTPAATAAPLAPIVEEKKPETPTPLPPAVSAATADESKIEPPAATEAHATAADAPATTPAVDAPALAPAPSEPAATEPPKPKKPRAPRKPKPEEVMVAMAAETPAAAAAEPVSEEKKSEPILSADPAPEPTPAATAEPAPAPPAQAEPEPMLLSVSDDDSPSEDRTPIEASASSDGATRLLATAYIGIGNKLFIRGDGPGLSWDKGVPMQFVSIGKWGWFTHDAAGPIRCKLYKNDEIACMTGEVLLEASRHTEVTALF